MSLELEIGTSCHRLRLQKQAHTGTDAVFGNEIRLLMLRQLCNSLSKFVMAILPVHRLEKKSNALFNKKHLSQVGLSVCSLTRPALAERHLPVQKRTRWQQR